MTLALFVQELKSHLNLFVHSRDPLSQNQALLISQHFAKQITKNTNVRGEVIILNRFRCLFILLNEVYIVAISYMENYPFHALHCLQAVKSLCFEVCKGVEVTTSQLYKSYGKLILGLEEIINETLVEQTYPMDLLQQQQQTLSQRMHLLSQFELEDTLPTDMNIISLELESDSFIPPNESPKSYPSTNSVKRASIKLTSQQQQQHKSLYYPPQLQQSVQQSVQQLPPPPPLLHVYQEKQTWMESDSALDNTSEDVDEESETESIISNHSSSMLSSLNTTTTITTTAATVNSLDQIMDKVKLPSMVDQLDMIKEKVAQRSAIHVIPLTVQNVETISFLYKNGSVTEYQFVGHVSVQRVMTENLARDSNIEFLLEIKNIQLLSNYIVNQKFCKQVETKDFLCLECCINSNLLMNNEEIILLKYKLKNETEALPFEKLEPKYRLNQDTLQYMIQYEWNPKLLVSVSNEVIKTQLSLLVAPCNNPTICTVQSVQSKPEGRWNSVQQKLLWKLEEAQAKCLAQFKLNNYQQFETVGSLLLKWQIENSNGFAQLQIEGSERRKNSKNQVFLGGIHRKVMSGSTCEVLF